MKIRHVIATCAFLALVSVIFLSTVQRQAQVRTRPHVTPDIDYWAGEFVNTIVSIEGIGWKGLDEDPKEPL